MTNSFDISLFDAAIGEVELVADWLVDVPAGDRAILYLVVKGTARVEIPGDKPQEVGPDWIVSLPSGHAHKLRKSSLADDTTVLLVATTSVSGNPLPDILPKVIYVSPAERGVHERLKKVLELARLQEDAPDSIRRLNLIRIAELLALELTEFAMTQSGDKWRLLTPDRRIRRTLSAVHAVPERQWTLETLAQEARMSRSGFALKFRKLVGDSPLNYVRQIRIHRSAAEIKDGNFSLQRIASMAGYSSVASFSKAFKRVMGLAPSQYRGTDSESGPGSWAHGKSYRLL